MLSSLPFFTFHCGVFSIPPFHKVDFQEGGKLRGSPLFKKMTLSGCAGDSIMNKLLKLTNQASLVVTSGPKRSIIATIDINIMVVSSQRND